MNQKLLLSELLKYSETQFVKESKALAALRQFAMDHEFSHKMTTPVQAQFLAFLIRMMRAQRVLEVGAFLGYSTLAMAEALPESGEVIAIDHNAKWLEMGRPFWQQADMAHKILTYIDDASIALQNLLDEGQAGTFDFIYIDAEKQYYPQYLEMSLQLIQPKGVLVFDNILRVIHGDVVNPKTPTTRALAAFNCLLQQRNDLVVSVVPMYDGIVLVSPK